MNGTVSDSDVGLARKFTIERPIFHEHLSATRRKKQVRQTESTGSHSGDSRASNISYHRAIGCETARLGFLSYPPALFFIGFGKTDFRNSLITNRYLARPTRCNTDQSHFVTLIVEIIFSTYYRVYNEIEASGKKPLGALPSPLLTESHGRILFPDSDSR